MSHPLVRGIEDKIVFYVEETTKHKTLENIQNSKIEKKV